MKLVFQVFRGVEQTLNFRHMFLHGKFLNRYGAVISVYIVTHGDRSVEVEIGSEESGIQFADNPVEIQSEVNDTFDHLQRQQATIRLDANRYLPELFCANCHDVVVNIFRDDECVFAGYVMPQTYSQSFNSVYDNLEINCIDALTALQYSNYNDVGCTGVDYNDLKKSAGQRSLWDIIYDILEKETFRLNILGGSPVRYLYDRSRATTYDSPVSENPMDCMSISELLFLGDTESDVWTNDAVIEAIVKYFNLRVIQHGFTFYFFAIDTLKNQTAIDWLNLIDGSDSHMPTKQQIELSSSVVEDTDTQISVGEIFNQVELSCKLEPMDTLIESPLDSNSLTSPYSNRQKYITEYSADGEGVRAERCFKTIISGSTDTDYDSYKIIDWYAWIKENPQWIFPVEGDLSRNLIDEFCQDNANQQNLLNYLSKNSGATLVAFGSVDRTPDKKDNSLVPKIDMTNYLVLSVNGNGVDPAKGTPYPGDDDIKSHIPYAVYQGSVSGGVLSPPDTETTNYVVISGDIVMNPIMKMSGAWYHLRQNTSSFGTVPSRTHKDGRFYTRQYFKADYPTSTPVADWKLLDGFVPFTNDGPQEYEFKYSAVGDSSDHISKVAVLSCMLIVGDKCVVEIHSGEGTKDYVWRKYKSMEECADEDVYYAQSFTIGFDPKIGDKLIGTEFPIQNNIDYTLGLDVEGTAIPITKGDKISGSVTFMILGPVNTVWDEITRRHPTFFRHTKWTEKSVPLLAHTSSIMVKDLDIKLYSDNGLVTDLLDNDLTYVSDTDEAFVNKKDGLEFTITSALTAEERRELGVTNIMSLSTPVLTSTGNSVTDIYDRIQDVTAKAEQLYVDSYYQEFHTPKIIMEQNMQDRNGIVDLFGHYYHPALDKVFFVQSISRNLVESYANMTMKEV